MQHNSSTSFFCNCVFWIISNVAPQMMRAVCVRKVRQLLSSCQKSSLKFNIFISSSPFSLHMIQISIFFISNSILLLGSYHKYSFMQDPEVMLSLWQGRQLQQISQCPRGAQVHQRSPQARREVQVPPHTHWTYLCPVAVPSRAHRGESHTHPFV